MTEHDERGQIKGAEDQPGIQVIGYPDPWQYDKNHWKEVLSWPNLEYTGDIDRGAELLMEFSLGMKAVHDDPDLAGISPELGLAYGGEAEINLLQDPTHNLAIIGVKLLSSLSSLDP